MTSEFERLLQQGVPEPPPQPDVDPLLRAAKRRTTLRRGAVAASVAGAVAVAVGVPLALRGSSTPSGGVGSSPAASAPRLTASQTAVSPPADPSTTTGASAASAPAVVTEAIPSGVQEGPAIDWNGPMSDGVTVDPKKLSEINGLAFKPVLPAWHPAPYRAEVTSAATSAPPGRHVVLRYRFTGDPNFPSDPRIVVEESILLGKASDFNGLATGTHPGITTKPIKVSAGSVGLLLEGAQGVSLLVAKGDALIWVEGPAVSAAAAEHLAATFG